MHGVNPSSWGETKPPCPPHVFQHRMEKACFPSNQTGTLCHRNGKEVQTEAGVMGELCGGMRVCADLNLTSRWTHHNGFLERRTIPWFSSASVRNGARQRHHIPSDLFPYTAPGGGKKGEGGWGGSKQFLTVREMSQGKEVKDAAQKAQRRGKAC